MLPLKLNLHFSRVHFITLVADALTKAPKNDVTAKKINLESREFLTQQGDADFEEVPNKGPAGNNMIGER